MKTSDKMRREVAQRLRILASHAPADSEMVLDALELWPGEYIEGFDPCCVNDLADLIEPDPASGETSDGYHTFNELYHHRAVLFSVIVASFHDMAWKAKAHHDGTMYDGMFIVGIDTPDGQATYHYDIEPYWGMFRCKELDRAPEWDGHTPEQAIERISKLADLIGRESDTTEDISKVYGTFECKRCGCVVKDTCAIDNGAINYCPDCGLMVV